MQWKRGLWRAGWVLWAITAVPIVYLAHQESIGPDYQWERHPNERPKTLPPGYVLDRPGEKGLEVEGIGTAYVPDYLTEEQTPKALSVLDKQIAVNPSLKDARVTWDDVYTCTVQRKANRPKVVLYSGLGMSLGFAFIQGGFRVVLWVIAGFRNHSG